MGIVVHRSSKNAWRNFHRLSPERRTGAPQVGIGG
ncbi:hypothetical protein SEA_DUMPTRUCK_67 [Gordonia phage DumpTruck]|nr:hypothetical protein SEA_DUMPTRUCK_67 [Gordonia phage DumpTruck]